MMRRVPEVLDCWFESGSMPFAQVHYPFENADWFEHHYPGDFIVEYIGQTRGWFYTLHVLATALFDRPAFRNCVSHGIVLGDDGQKMSKCLRNYPDPMRCSTPTAPTRCAGTCCRRRSCAARDLIVTEDGHPRHRAPRRAAAVERVVLPHPVRQRRRHTGTAAHATQTDVLDRYVLAKIRDLVDDVTAPMDAYDLFGACAHGARASSTRSTNWYVRRSRERFWAGDPDAIDTLHTVLRRCAAWLRRCCR